MIPFYFPVISTPSTHALSNPLILFRVAGGLELIPAYTEKEVCDTLNRFVTIYHRSNISSCAPIQRLVLQKH